ncbi:MAG: HAD-IIB family hydrolase [Defluviitaleaceae bacterium]|nr:HAD-IIB family hydrolase [Defluviitaleaceae bacterium]MCL2275019.1 HAD-IIB family hydrolase [Defluviitaleaceae bacterium]
MTNFNAFPAAGARALKYILFDIDDTITTHGQLSAEAYASLWSLYTCGLVVIPVTGRPAGWCDLIVRQWPVHAVIGENGAFSFYRTKNGYAELTHPNVHENAQEKLIALRDACLAQVPLTRVAKDQFARRYDLAIDFCEDEPKLGLEEAYKVQEICKSFGAQAKVSSIHVNTWFGEYDKCSMAEMLLTQIFNEKNFKDVSLFFGDSPNDEPMFGFFPHACAVANILPFIEKLTHKPAYIAQEESGRGFAQSIKHLQVLRA